MNQVKAARAMARVVRVAELGPGLGRIDLRGPRIGVDVRAGRFAMVEAPGRYECVLLRPFSYFLAPSDDEVSLLAKDVGAGTHALLTATPGTAIAVLGALGSHFPAPAGRVLAVAGGVGAAPFGLNCAAPGMRVIFGARTAAEAGFANALRDVGGRVEVATDDGSAGFHGTAVALLERRLEAGDACDAILTCGPTPMMQAVAAVAARHGIPAWASLEARMGCGIGVCRGCAHVDAGGGWRCICVDGPVYPAATIFAASGDVAGDGGDGGDGGGRSGAPAAEVAL